MDKQLETKLNDALRDIRNAAVPLPDEEVHDVIVGLQVLRQRITDWTIKSGSRK